MFEVDKFLYKPFFGEHCESRPEQEHHCKPRYTMTEEVEHTARLMRETIERLLKFEERVKAELASLTKNLMSDNVIFKNSMYEGYNSFLMEVKNEINVFEHTLESDVKLFKEEIESNNATVSETLTVRFSEFETKYEKEMSDLNSSIQNQYEAFVENVNSRIDLNNENTSQAFADFQRHLTTELNTFEQNMTANYDSFTESIGNTISSAEQNWQTITSTRFAQQDGKISDAIAYMKTNLGSTVNTLIGDMHANGELATIIEHEILNDVVTRSKMEYHEATEQLGLATCADFCRANDRVFYVPRGVVLNVRDTLDLTGIDVEINGTLNIIHNGVGIKVGDISNSSVARKIVINEITHSAWKTGDASVRIQGLMNGDVWIGNAPSVELLADGDSDHDAIAYSNFHIGKCNYLTIRDNANASKIGWINENTFYNCRVCNQFVMQGSTYSHNNNVFYKPCFENAKVILSNCRRNKFYDVRNEGEFYLTLNEDTDNNFIRLNYYFDNFTYLAGNIHDMGMNNVITTSALEGYEKVLVYNMNYNTFSKELYKVYAQNMTASDYSIEGSQGITAPAWAKFLNVEHVPVKGVKAIRIKSDVKKMRVTVAAVDSDGIIMTNNPLVYVGIENHGSDGRYNPGANIDDALIIIKDPNVKALELTIENGNEEAYYESISMYAYHSPTDYIAGATLIDLFKN